MRPFEGSVDEWPAERSFWLDVVMSLREQVQTEKQHEAQSAAEYEQWKQQRQQRKGLA